jgi:electron-transferring-flavoprotein dehydrogenase
VPPGRLAPGTVIHTLGYPLRHEEFGGGFIYAPARRIALARPRRRARLPRPAVRSARGVQQLKQHPFVSGSSREGSWCATAPRRCRRGAGTRCRGPYMDGGLIAGDAGGFVNSMRLKGIHLAMRTGMLAAESAFEAVRRGDTSAAVLQPYEHRIDATSRPAELYPVRTCTRPSVADSWPGCSHPGCAGDRRASAGATSHGHAGHERMQRLAEYHGSKAVPLEPRQRRARRPADHVRQAHERALLGHAHDEDQPAHLLVHTEVCRDLRSRVRSPVHALLSGARLRDRHDAEGRPRLQINASNCVHCKTCDIMDPYGVITWVPPEGGGGPQYNGM